MNNNISNGVLTKKSEFHHTEILCHLYNCVMADISTHFNAVGVSVTMAVGILMKLNDEFSNHHLPGRGVTFRCWI